MRNQYLAKERLSVARDKIQEKKNINSEYIKFIYKQKKLDDNTTVAENGIINEDTLFMLYEIK